MGGTNHCGMINLLRAPDQIAAIQSYPLIRLRNSLTVGGSRIETCLASLDKTVGASQR
jgi:hypothetical protein